MTAARSPALASLRVHLVDGTYELFRHFYALPRAAGPGGREIGALRGVLGSVLGLIEQGATHLAVATDHVIESFRNDLWPGYKTGAGLDPALREQFEPLEAGLAAMGVVVWAMVELEADDALGAGAVRAAADARVVQVIVCTPDKDLAQVVSGERIVQLDRRRGLVRDEAGVRARFGVGPESIPDYLALVGDSADGYPGLPGWGARSTAAVLARFVHLENVPARAADWHLEVSRAGALAAVLAERMEEALLFRRLATLRTDAPVLRSVDELRWSGPRPEFEQLCRELRAPGLTERAARAAQQRG